MNGLGYINIELTSVCNKNCWMCGRRKIDKDFPEIAMNYGHMNFELVKKIANQLPKGIVAQLHNNGEPLLYPRFGDAAKLFYRQVRCVDTNGKLIVDKADEIINILDSLTISVIENDLEGDEQYRIVKEFLKIKKDKKPLMIYRCLGDVDTERWKKLDGIIAKRMLHHPLGSFRYKKEPAIPEIGMCIEILNHMAINRFGEVSLCVRFDPKRIGVIGNINEMSLKDIWNSKKRLDWVQCHINGQRNKVPLCRKCDYWGIPKG
jgi:MoaA/NifB/PqqE/SkfB family radical SAM enzyme